MIQRSDSLRPLGTHFSHVVARCMRHARLAGFDDYTERDCSHRKAWILERLAFLSDAFCIDVCAYAVMSTHYELVLHVDFARCEQLPAAEVIDRWSRMFRPPAWRARWEEGSMEDAERQEAQRLIERWRSHLCEVPWFMSGLNAHVARRANAEEGSTGNFWERRLKSRTLPDAVTLLTAMAYIDLSPVRAGRCDTPDPFGSTSIQARIQESFQHPDASRSQSRSELRLLGFDSLQAPAGACLPFTFREYLELLNWTARRLHGDGAEPRPPLLLEHFALNCDAWLCAMGPPLKAGARISNPLRHVRHDALALRRRIPRPVH